MLNSLNHTLDLTTIRAVVLDMDGVIWRGAEILPGVPDFFLFLRERGIPYAMATNNASKTVAEYVTRLAGLNIPIDGEHIITSAVVTADALAAEYPSGTPIYVIGSDSLIGLLTARGNVFDPKNAQVVVVGLDVNLTYEKLKIALQRIVAGAEFIGTNADLVLPVAGEIAPGNGGVVVALQAMSGRTPRIMGKPETAMFETALARLGYPAEQTLMVGDRLGTDIEGANRAGLKSALVLTGISGPGDTEADSDATSTVIPDGVYESLADLHMVWRGLD